jgi:ABC-type transporter Mla subunit MlaD
MAASGARDEGMGNLEQFIATLTETGAAYQKNTNKVDDFDSKFSDQEDKVEEVLDGLNDDVQTFTEEFLQKHQDNLGGLDELISSLEDIINGRLGDVIKSLEEIANTVDQECSDHREGTQEQFDGLKQDGYEHAKEGKGEVSNSVKSKKGDAQKNFGNLDKNVNHLSKDTDDKHKEAQDTFHDVSEHTSGELSDNVNSANESFTNGLDEGLSNITDTLGDVGGAIEEMFNLFNGGFDDLGSKLMDMGKDILSSAVDHMQDELMETLKQSFEDMIQQVIQGLIEQIIESIVMMTVGETVTAALGAYTPVLVVCKDVVGVINDLLDALNLGL